MRKFHRPPIGSSIQCQHKVILRFWIEDCGHWMIRCGHSPKWFCRPDRSHVIITWAPSYLNSNRVVKVTHFDGVTGLSSHSRPNDRCEIFDCSAVALSLSNLSTPSEPTSYATQPYGQNYSLYAFCISMALSFKVVLFCLLHDSSSCETTAV